MAATSEARHAAQQLGQTLKTLRGERGLTQLELATRAGLSRAYLAALERGLSSATREPPRPSRAALLSLSRALEVSLERLAGVALPLPVPEAAGGAWRDFGAVPGEFDPQGKAFAGLAGDGVVAVGAPGVPELELGEGDRLLVRLVGPGAAPTGLCLLEGPAGLSWGRIAEIGGRPYREGPDGSYRPLARGWQVRAVAIALIRRL